MRLLTIAMLLAAATTARAEPPKYRGPIGVSIVPPLEVFHDDNTIVIGASVNAIYGRSRAVYGVEVGLVNSVREDVGLIQVGVFVNLAGGGCYGACVAGIGNQHGKLVGVQASILGNEATKVPFGLQAGFLNVIRRDSSFSVQVGFANINNRKLADVMAVMAAKQGDVVRIHLLAGRQHGIQLGLVNNSDDYRGLQVGLANIAEAGKGIQVGAVVNAATKWSGIQAAPFNYARDMRGLQVGLVNITKRLEGVQIGAINIATKNSIPFTVLVNAGF